MALSFEQFQKLRQQGLSNDQIRKFEGGYVPPGVTAATAISTAAAPGATTTEGGGFEDWLAQPAMEITPQITPSLGTAAGEATNIGKSLLRFGYGVAKFLNPVENIKKIASTVAQIPSATAGLFSEEAATKKSMAQEQTMAQQVQDLIKQNKAKEKDTTHLEKAFKSIQSTQPSANIITGPMGAGEALKNISGAVWQQIASPALEKAVSGDIEGALKSAAEDPYQFAPYFLMLKAGLEKTALGETKIGKAIDVGMEKVGGPGEELIGKVAKPVETVLKGAANLGSTLAKFATGQITGLSPDTISRIISNPEEFSPQAMKTYTREGIGGEAIKAIQTRLTDLSETGKEYQEIREAKTPVTIPKGTFEKILSDNGIKVDKTGKLIFDKESLPTTSGDRTALQNWYDTFGKETKHTSNSFLNARKGLDQLAQWDATKSDAANVMAKQLRVALNEVGRPQVPGLADLDAEFAPELKILKKIKTDYFNKDGTLKDNALSKIANLSNEGRQAVLARLEEISPGISEKIRTLKAVEDIQRASGQKVGAYARGALGGGGGAIIGALTGGPVGSAIGAVVSAVLTNPEIAAQILRGYGKLLNVKDTVVEAAIKGYNTFGKIITADITKAGAPKAGLSLEDVSTKVGAPTALEDVSKKVLGGIPETTIKTFQMYSPNIEENVTYDEAVRRLNSSRQAEIKSIVQDINKKYGLNGVITNVIGDTKTYGTENALMEQGTIELAPENLANLKRAAAEKGLAGNQKTVLNFVEDPIGKDNVYIIEHTKDELFIRQFLDENGIEFRTLDKGKFVIYDESKGLVNQINQIVKDLNGKIETIPGKGEFIGGETRAQGLQAYRKILTEKSSIYSDSRLPTATAATPATIKPAVTGTVTSPQEAGFLSPEKTAEAPSAIEQVGQEKITDIHKFLRADNLPTTDRIVETAAYNKILAQEQNIIDAAVSKYGKTVNADDFRTFFSDRYPEFNVGYNGTNSAAVQEPVSYLAKRSFAQQLNNPGDYAIFTSGGSGVGKSAALNNLPRYSIMEKDSAVILDSNLSNYEKAVLKIEEAEATGKQVPVYYIYREPIDALENGVVRRMLKNPDEMGRVVPNSVIAGNHIDSWAVAQRLKGNDVEVYFVDNSLGTGKAKEVIMEDLQQKINYPSEQELTNLLNQKIKQLYEQGSKYGKITYEQYQVFIRP